jgi:hypothetical protein
MSRRVILQVTCDECGIMFQREIFSAVSGMLVFTNSQNVKGWTLEQLASGGCKDYCPRCGHSVKDAEIA